MNFLEVLSAGSEQYVLNESARAYMRRHKFPEESQDRLNHDRRFKQKTDWEKYLRSVGVAKPGHKRIATEGALVSALLLQEGYSELVIVSDDAPQFNVDGFLNALCWIHAERTINRIIPFTDTNREALKKVRGEIWEFYQSLKSYKQTPNSRFAATLTKRFDTIFSQKTHFHTLNRALKRIHDNKEELLLVIQRPEIPLHNNLSENDIRDYVTRRNICHTTRSDKGRKARDSFLSLKKTCNKLGVAFQTYLFDRISQNHSIPPLQNIIQQRALNVFPLSF